MADKLDGNAIIANTIPANRIQTGSITSTQLQTSLYNTVTSATHPKIRSISYPGNDTAANTGGGDTVTLTGTGFGNTGNVQIYINGNVVSSITVTNANSISFTAPALAAATYPVYLINTSDGSTAILIPGIQYSGTPSWSTSTPLSNQDASSTWSIQLVATSDSSVSYSLQAGSSLPAGITLAANGLISGTMTSPPSDETTYNFTVVANDLENQDASRAFSVTVTVTVLDPYFTYTTLLLHGDGTNNANNHAFVDSSNNAFAITRNGNASQGTFSPFGDNWSNYFDGPSSGTYLRTPASTAFQLGTSNFTIEFWAFLTNSSNNIMPIQTDSGGSGYYGMLLNFNDSGYIKWYVTSNGSSWDVVNGAIICSISGVLNQWAHFAYVRNGTSWKVYVNGIEAYSLTSSASIYQSANQFTYGSGYAGSHVSNYAGYLSNFRYVKGTAVYTSNFTPSTTPLTSIANTQFLTCQSNSFVDKSPNLFSITRAGNPKISKFDPFKPYKAIPASYGVYFDGTGDYLTVPDDANWNLTSSTGSYELFVYPVAAPSNTPGLIGQCPTTANWGTYLYSDGRIAVGIQGTSELAAAAGSLTVGAWNHIVFTRDNSDSRTRIFVNGVLKATGTGTYFNDSSAALHIGHFNNYSFNGHISNVRVCKGSIPSSYITSNTTVGTTIFTTPTSALTAVANTVLLACQSTTIIDNSTNAYTITRNGDARPTDLNPFTTTFVSEKYNTANVGGSAYMDGTGDYLSLPSSTAWQLTGDFAAENWFYPTSVSQIALLDQYTGSTTGQGNWQTWVSSGTVYFYYDGNIAINGGTVIANQWNHVAAVRTGSTIAIMVNGSRVATGTYSGTVGRNDTLWIGSQHAGGPLGNLNGYMADSRIIKGSNPYGVGTTYTIPTAPLTAVANTIMLCNFTNAGILDSVGKNVLETVGDARVNTSVKKYGTGSMYFDGTGDYLKAVATVDNIAYGTGDFTVECWAYFVNAANLQKIFDNYNGNNNPNAALCISNPNANKIQWYSGQTKIVESTSSLSNNTWYHIAVSRTGSTTRLFINGNQEASASDSSSYAIGNGNISIGAEISTGLYSVNGHIDDLRITKGVARYRYSFTPPTKAFNDGDGNLANNTTDVLVGDQVNLPVFPYTTLLLHGDGTNNANNHAFLDSSNNAFAITRNGNATQGTFSPFSPTGWSAYFDGTGDYLSGIGTTSSFNFMHNSTALFTLECWVYVTASALNTIASNNDSGTAAIGFFALVNSTNNLRIQITRGSAGSPVIDATSSGTVPLNQWTHVAITYDQSLGSVNAKFYINGVASGTANKSGTTPSGSNASNALVIGDIQTGGADFEGYISNLRISNSIVYTTDFTPSTSALTTSSQGATSVALLTCQSNRFIDNSSNAFTITRNGNVSIQAFSPFAPSVEYTANTHGGSAYFDGTGDYLSVTNNVAFNLGTNSFCIDGWFYPTTTNATQLVFNKWGTVSDAQSMFQIGRISSTFYAQLRTTSGYVTLSTATWIPNAWNHFAVVRSGSTISAYLNGARFGTDTSNPTLNSGTDTMTIGSKQAQDYFTGYIADCRIINGSAIYDPTQTSITVPTAPTTAVTNTAFLSSSTNAGILDSTGKNVLETVGDARVNTATKKYGTGSMYFDGTGDWLTAVASNPNFSFGSGDWTVEFWLYTAQTTEALLVATRNSGGGATNTNWYIFKAATTNAITLYVSDGSAWQISGIGGGNVSDSVWHHIAVTRYGSSFKVFVDGIQVGSTGTWSGTISSTIRPLMVGSDYSGSTALNGYIDDLRITKGIARYVTNFTPPTTAFLNK